MRTAVPECAPAPASHVVPTCCVTERRATALLPHDGKEGSVVSAQFWFNDGQSAAVVLPTAVSFQGLLEIAGQHRSPIHPLLWGAPPHPPRKGLQHGPSSGGDSHRSEEAAGAQPCGSRAPHGLKSFRLGWDGVLGSDRSCSKFPVPALALSLSLSLSLSFRAKEERL